MRTYLTNPHEPRCHQNGMDARRRDAAKAGRLGKERNDADARFGDNPRERGGRGAWRCCLVLVCINTRRPRRLALRRAHLTRGHADS